MFALTCCSDIPCTFGADARCSHIDSEGFDVVDGLVLLQMQAGPKISSSMTEAYNNTLIAETGNSKLPSTSADKTAMNSKSNLTGPLPYEPEMQTSLLAVVASVRKKVRSSVVARIRQTVRMSEYDFYPGVVVFLALIPCFFITMCWALSVTTYEKKPKPPRRQHRWAPAPSTDGLVALCDRYMSPNWNMPFKTPSDPLKQFRRPPQPDEEIPPVWKSFILDSTGVPILMITVSRNQMGSQMMQLVEPARGRPIAFVDDALTIRDENGTLFGQLQQQTSECPWNYKLFVMRRGGDYVPEAGKNMYELAALGRTSDGMQLIAVSIPQKGKLLAKGKRIWGTWRNGEIDPTPAEQLVFETQVGVDAVLVVAAFIGILLFEPGGFNPGSMSACLDAPRGLPDKMQHLF